MQRRALQHWNAGDYHLCLSLLEDVSSNHQSSELVLLAGRALLRVGRYAEAERRLADGLILHRSVDATATHALLMGVARGRAEDFAGADMWFARAREAGPHRSILAETCYEEALARYQAGRLDEARAIVVGALKPIEDIIHARALSLVGWIETASGKYPTAFEAFSAALVALSRCRARDTYLQGSIVHALAILCAEAGLGDPASLEEHARNVRWTSSMTLTESQTLRHIGLAYRYRGDYERAVALFIASADTSEGTAWSIVGYADCANASFVAGETIGAGAFAAKAVGLAERIGSEGWRQIDGEKRVSLLVLAEMLARLGDGERARRFRALYDERPGLPSMNALSHDRRLATFRDHVDALLRGALGEREVAAALLRQIAVRWHRIGYGARAAEAERDADRLAVERRETPRAVSAPRCGGLTVRDAEILRMVGDGRDDAAIADRFNLSRRTVRNIVFGMYAKFDVHNRAQLVAASRSAYPSGA